MSDYRYDPRKGFIPLEVAVEEEQVIEVPNLPSSQQTLPQEVVIQEKEILARVNNG